MKNSKKYFTNFNAYWKIIHIIAILFILLLFMCKAYASLFELGHPVDIHAPTAEEMQMEEKYTNKVDQMDKINTYYDQKEENVKNWYKEDDYCDKDLRDKVLDKLNSERKEKIKEARENDYTFG